MFCVFAGALTRWAAAGMSVCLLRLTPLNMIMMLSVYISCPLYEGTSTIRWSTIENFDFFDNGQVVDRYSAVE